MEHLSNTRKKFMPSAGKARKKCLSLNNLKQLNMPSEVKVKIKFVVVVKLQWCNKGTDNNNSLVQLGHGGA